MCISRYFKYILRNTIIILKKKFADRIGRSMPNLNKIRGQNKGTVGLPKGSQMSQGRGSTIAYGLSRQHTSDPRMQPRLNAYPGAIPSRGAVMSRDVSTM